MPQSVLNWFLYVFETVVTTCIVDYCHNDEKGIILKIPLYYYKDIYYHIAIV